jgi:hypothetical protein
MKTLGVYTLLPQNEIFILVNLMQIKSSFQSPYADRDWYKGVTSTNHTYISSIFTSASIHEPATAIAVPVYNKAIAIDNTTKSHLSGYWVGVLDLPISESIKKPDLNQNDRILIVDHTGTIINSHSGLLNTTRCQLKVSKVY